MNPGLGLYRRTCLPNELRNLESDQKRSNPRCGFSLLELVLVIAVLIVFASLSVPMLVQTFRRQALVKGAELVRAEMGKARVRAIKTGQVHALYFISGQAWYSIAPFSEASEQSARASERIKQSETRAPYSDLEEDLLPRSITFVEVLANNDARAAQTVADEGDDATTSVSTVFFYPDGTSQDARIVIQDDKGAKKDIVLRGLTGTSVLRDHVYDGGDR